MRGRPLLPVTALLLAVWACARPAPEEEAYGISLPYELASLDPGERNRLSDFSLLSNFYEPLVVTDADLSPRPALAARWSNPDALTWLFELRPGVRFHDGARLTADDVVWTFERLRADPRLEMWGHVAAIESVRARGEGTVEIRTAAPVGILLNKLRFVLVVRRGEDGATLAKRVNGTGPYRLVSWTKGRALGLRRNEDYWGARPSFREVRFLINRTPGEALADFQSGRSRFIQSNAKSTEAALRGREGVVLRRNSSVSVKFLFFALGRSTARDVTGGRNPFLDVRVRRAVSAAIDRRELVRRLSFPATPANQLVTPYIFGHDPSRKPLPYDPVEARRLLAEAGFRDGFDLDLPARGLYAEAAGHVSEMLGRVGIRARVRSLSETEWFRAAEREELTLTISRFGCPTGDASDLFDGALQTWDPARKTGQNNYSRYSNPLVDELMRTAGRTLEMSRRRELLVRATARAMEDVAVVPLFIDQELYAHRPGVEWRPRNDNFLIASEIRRPR